MCVCVRTRVRACVCVFVCMGHSILYTNGSDMIVSYKVTEVFYQKQESLFRPQYSQHKIYVYTVYIYYIYLYI